MTPTDPPRPHHLNLRERARRRPAHGRLLSRSPRPHAGRAAARRGCVRRRHPHVRGPCGYQYHFVPAEPRLHGAPGPAREPADGHLAFRVDDVAALRARLDAAGIPYSDMASRPSRACTTCSARTRGPRDPVPPGRRPAARGRPRADRRGRPHAAPAAQRGRRLRRPRPRHAARPQRAEPPRQLGRLRDPDPRARDDLRVLPAGRPRPSADRPGDQVAAVEAELDVERLGQLAGTRAQLLRAAAAPRRARMVSMPLSGSSARTSTAAPTPSGSQTTLNSAWMP